MICPLIYLFFGIALSLGADSKKLSSRVVTTKYGSLRGSVSALPNRSWRPVEIYLGIPYASPPIGSLRFMPPVTPAHWGGIRIMDHLSAVCPQKLPEIKNETEALKRMPSGRLEYLKRLIPLLQNQSEDCLYLNIYAPVLGVQMEALDHSSRQGRSCQGQPRQPQHFFLQQFHELCNILPYIATYGVQSAPCNKKVLRSEPHSQWAIIFFVNSLTNWMIFLVKKWKLNITKHSN